MMIYGVRIYLQSVSIEPGIDAQFFVHSALSDERSDFDYIFSPLMRAFNGKFLSDSFCISYSMEGDLEDPIPSLREMYGDSLLAWDIENQLILLDGSKTSIWSNQACSFEGALYLVFNSLPEFEAIKNLYYGGQLKSNWPHDMHAIIHLWDGLFWQYFCRSQNEVEFLIDAHRNDPQLKMYRVDFESEFPNPGSLPLVEIDGVS